MQRDAGVQAEDVETVGGDDARVVDRLAAGTVVGMEGQSLRRPTEDFDNHGT